MNSKDKEITEDIVWNKVDNLKAKLKSILKARKREIKITFILLILFTILLIGTCIFFFTIHIALGIVFAIVLLMLKDTLWDGIKNTYEHINNGKYINY